jgi:hypothetical protein
MSDINTDNNRTIPTPHLLDMSNNIETINIIKEGISTEIMQ